MPQCNAKTKGTGAPCRNPAMTDSTKCRMHGGATPRGAASPHYKTGRYCRHVPDRLAARYEEARSDAELLTLHEEVALVDSLLIDTLSHLDTGESGDLWHRLSDKWREWQRWRSLGRVPEMGATLEEIGRLIEAGEREYGAQAELRQLLDQRRKLVESERKRLVQMAQLVTAEQAMTLVTTMIGVVQAHVPDPTTRRAIADELRRLTAPDPR